MGSQTDEIPFLTAEQITRQATHFLNSHDRHEELPVDVDSICDELGIGVIPMPLEKNFGVDAYISSDFKHIVVDEWCYTNNIPRARFSLAHEIGHYVLHKEFYERHKIDSIEAYMRFQNSIDASSQKKMEIQANMFAGALLVPSAHLANEMKTHFEESDTQIVSADMSQMQRLLISGAEKFHVSEVCLLLCVKRDYPLLHANLMAEVS